MVPQAQRLTLAAAGHVAHATNPAEYATDIRHFITTSTNSTMEVLS